MCVSVVRLSLSSGVNDLCTPRWASFCLMALSESRKEFKRDVKCDWFPKRNGGPVARFMGLYFNSG